MIAKKIETPLTKAKIASLRAGDEVCLTGVIFTARDAAHKRFHEMVIAGKPLPLGLKDAVIYYAGPTPPRPGSATGSSGTSQWASRSAKRRCSSACAGSPPSSSSLARIFFPRVLDDGTPISRKTICPLAVSEALPSL